MKFSQHLLSAWRRPWPLRLRLAKAPRCARPAAAQPEPEDRGFEPTQPAVLRCETAQTHASQR